jgi:predicted  nucleic acid-binding Zn-ribbon protein
VDYNMSVAHNISTEMVPETCPAIDEAFDIALTRVKEQTTSLREALITVIEEKLNLEERVEELEGEIKELESRIEELEDGE